MSDKTFHKLHLDFIKACSGLEGRKDLPASIKKKAKEWCDKMQKHQFEGVAKLGKELEEDIKSFKSRARAHMTAGRKRRTTRKRSSRRVEKEGRSNK